MQNTNSPRKNLVLIKKAEYERLVKNQRGKTEREQPKILGENEAFLLEAILSGDYDSVKINFKNREPETLELVRSQRADKRIFEVLGESDFQNIEIVQHKGRVTKIANTIKHRFKRRGNDLAPPFSLFG